MGLMHHLDGNHDCLEATVEPVFSTLLPFMTKSNACPAKMLLSIFDLGLPV
jgi:hypothetical protein